MVYVIAASLACLAYICIEYMFSILYRDRQILESRLEYIKDTGKKKQDDDKKKRKGMDLSFLKTSEEMKRNIDIAGINISAEEFVILWFLGSFFLLIMMYTFTEDIYRSMALLALGIIAPPIYIKIMMQNQRKLFEKQLGDILTLIANGLRAGFSFEQALSSAANNMSDPIRKEFLTVVRELQLGADMEESLGKVALRMQSEDLKLLTTAVVVQRKVGGNLSIIMETISGTIRDRLRISRMIRGLTAQGRLSGIVLGALPLFMGLSFTVINPAYMEPMFTTFLGKALLVLCAVLEIIAFFVIRKIIDIKL